MGLLTGATLLLSGLMSAVVPLVAPSAALASVVLPTSSSWCSANGGEVGAWVDSSPRIPVCGIGPGYGGTWRWIDVPGPFGERGTYYNATPGFQCVELAERFLAVVDGLAAVKANGAQVAANYHAAYANTTLVVNGSTAATGRAPASGDVISFSYSPSFGDDGHVAVVEHASVDPSTGDGTVTIAQENVAPSDYVRTLGLSHWRLYDPSKGPGAEYSYPYAEWLRVSAPISPQLRVRLAAARHHPRRGLGPSKLVQPKAPNTILRLAKS